MKLLTSVARLLVAMSSSCLTLTSTDEKPPTVLEQFAEVVLTVEGMT